MELLLKTIHTLHGKTLQFISRNIWDYYGWKTMGIHKNIKCFNEKSEYNPEPILLRKTPC
ncbi:MAG: VF530 family DNA-binding protein [Bacteroidetes bacterium]|nr:VF530 family DNA-binding protein [Bacteroidota bacterium]